GPAKAFAPHADAVAHGLAILHDEVEELLLGIDNDGAGLLSGLVGDDLPPEFAWHLFDRDARQLIARIGKGSVFRRKEACGSIAAAARDKGCQAEQYGQIEGFEMHECGMPRCRIAGHTAFACPIFDSIVKMKVNIFRSPQLIKSILS